MIKMLIEEIKIESKILRLKRKIKFLENYENGKIKEIEREVKTILNSEYLTDSMVEELRNISLYIDYEKLRRERWKVDYFLHIIGISSFSSFILGISTKDFIDSGIKNFVEYMQNINIEK